MLLLKPIRSLQNTFIILLFNKI